jgi:uncharacterized membrane protein YraQ (UPF0718 family)
VDLAWDCVATFAVRTGQAAALSAPTLLTGMLAAGVLHAYVGGDRARRWLSRGDGLDWLRAWLAATLLLPVCAVGVLPVLATMHAMRLRMGSLAVVALAGPVFTPWTLGYATDRVGWTGLATMLGGSLATSLVSAALVERLSRTAVPSADRGTYPPSFAGLLRASATSLTRGCAMAGLATWAGAGLLAAAVPPNAVGEWLVERSLAHAFILSLAGVATYMPPELTAMRAGEAVNASVMPGLLVPLIVTGAAVSLGTIAVAVRALGLRAASVTLTCVLLTSAACGWLADRGMFDADASPEDTHAFEELGRPFHMLDHPDGVTAGMWHRFRQPLTPAHAVAAAAIASLTTYAILVRRRSGAPRQVTRERLPSLRPAALAAFAAVPIAFCYTYYPSPSQIAAEARVAAADFAVAARTGDYREVRRLGRLIDRRLSQLPTARLLRGRSAPPGGAEAIASARQQLREQISQAELGTSPPQASVTALQRSIAALLREAR